MYRVFVFFSSLVIAYAAINSDKCGLRPLAKLDNKLLGGKVAINGDWGWQVSITNNGRHFCGGILIDNEWVLCAAHCFSASTIVANLGVELAIHDRILKEPWTVTRKVSKVVAHPSFNSNQFSNDISILKLATPVQFDDKYIVPACLLDETVVNSLEETANAWVSGWGALYLNGPLLQYLNEATFKLKTNASCKTKYGNMFDQTKQICAVETGQVLGPCQGDSGGPLVTLINGLWYAIGIVSWGYGCGDGGVYTRISAYKSWYESVIQSNP